MKTSSALAVGALLLAAVAIAAVEAAPSDVSSGGWPPDTSPPDRSHDATHAEAWPIVGAAGVDVLSRELTVPEHLYTQAVAWLETNYGGGWDGAMVGSNNWGAVQCGLHAQDAPGCIPYRDSQSSGQGYPVSFKSYPDPESGAQDVVRNVLVLRPITASVLVDPNGTVFRASFAMRREKYYGGFCPNATAAYGAEEANASFGNPDRDEGTMACEEEAVTAHAHRAYETERSIAAAVGVDPMPLGSYEDAAAWWQSRRGA